MLPLNVSLGQWTVQTYTLMMGIAVIACGAGVIVRRGKLGRVGATVDVLLGVLVGAIIGARVVHVLLNLRYFVNYPEDALRLNGGGLDWHGAVLGGVLGWWIITKYYRWRRLQFDRGIFDRLAWCVPLLTLASWSACISAHCGYGREVESLAGYPTGLIAELSDLTGMIAPRYNTYLLGVLLALFLFMLCFIRHRWFENRRFWFVSAALSLGMFGIGFLRGDFSEMLLGLRAEQWLDVGLLVVSCWLLVFRR